jgi:hypothetical protein
MKDISPDLAKTSLEKEKKVGKMMAWVTGLFFLVYSPLIIRDLVAIIFYFDINSFRVTIWLINVFNSYFGFFTIQVDSNARITMPAFTIICLAINYSIGIIDPLVYLFFQKKYREEIKRLLKSIFRLEQSTEQDVALNTLERKTPTNISKLY